MGKPFASELKRLPASLKWAAALDVAPLRKFIDQAQGNLLVAIGAGGSFMTAELHKMRAQTPDTASTTEDARDRLVRIREEFSGELSILSDTYERFATARNLMDIGADPKEMLRRVKIVFGITDREMDIECRDGPNEPWFGSMLAGKPLSELEFMQRAVNYYRSASETRGTKH